MIRVRFAPSPSGWLHVGNARTALFNFLLARGHGGAFILRIEDTDVARSSDASTQGILDDLRWLGLDWDEGPDVGGPAGPYRQSERQAVYQAQAERLIERGAAYRCFCESATLEAARAAAIAAGQVPRYPGTCRAVPTATAAARAAAGAPFAVRFRVPDVPAVRFDDTVRGVITIETAMIGDFVLLRQTGQPAYNFAVVVDDAAMGITDVIRGEDHIPNTPRQVLLYEALGLPPPRFAHLSLVMGPDHAPLSKRHGATSVREFREAGILPEALVNYLALIGWSPGDDEEILPLPTLAARFRVGDVNRSAGVFDPDKLAWMNRHYQRECPPGRLARLLLPFLAARDYVSADSGAALAFIVDLTPMVAGAVDRLADGPTRLEGLFAFPDAAGLRDAARMLVADTPDAPGVVVALAQVLDEAGPLHDAAAFRAAAQQVRSASGAKGRTLFHTIRVALTGRDSGPELDLLVPAIEAGARLPASSGVIAMPDCRARARAFARALDGASTDMAGA